MRRLRLTSLVAIMGGAIACASNLRAQIASGARDKEYVSQLSLAVRNLSKDKYYLGGDNCLDCHKLKDNPRICRQETDYWEKDHHKNAFQILKESKRAHQIGE